MTEEEREEIAEIERNKCAKCYKSLTLSDQPVQRMPPAPEPPFWLCTPCVHSIRREVEGTPEWNEDEGWDHFQYWRPELVFDYICPDDSDSTLPDTPQQSQPDEEYSSSF